MTIYKKNPVLIARAGWERTQYDHTLKKGVLRLQWIGVSCRIYIASTRYSGCYEKQIRKICFTRSDVNELELLFRNQLENLIIEP